MKIFITVIILITLLIRCSTNSAEVDQYRIYSAIIDSEFSHLNLKKPTQLIIVNDTICDFIDELSVLEYSVEHNSSFSKEYLEGDTTFNDFILNIKKVNTNNEVMLFKKIKSAYNYRIETSSRNSMSKKGYYINFSKIVFNKARDRALLFITDMSSGSSYLMHREGKEWVVKHKVNSYNY